MELVRDFLKENLMVLVFGAVLFGFVFDLFFIYSSFFYVVLHESVLTKMDFIW